MKVIRRVRIKVKGIVQGVGFRPTVYKHAISNGVSGFVMNTTEGVTIEAEGLSFNIDSFIKDVVEHPPRISRITDLDVKDISPEGDLGFKIVTSLSVGNKDVEISPDVAICSDCERDIFDVNNRRYHYPFTNCTNCGPRFTIVVDRPYDRKNTSMKDFVMCEECSSEYKDPLDRRFHAQPNACPKCGPKVFILPLEAAPESDPIKSIEVAIKAGKLAGIKSLGGFNIACDAFNLSAVNRLREKKKRGSKAFALMMRDLEAVSRYCHFNEQEKNILLSKTAPIVLLRKKNSKLDHISIGNNYVGVMLPYTPLHKILMADLEVLVMTSANRADEPIAVEDSEIIKLTEEGFIDVALSNNRDIVNRCDDSIVQVIDGDLFVIRRARGFVPSAVRVRNVNNRDNLSMGADLKNTFALKKNDLVYISQHIGDLEDQRNVEYQREQVQELLKIIDAKPLYRNIDAHPNYANFNNTDNKVFHHHAHALSVMAEHDLIGQEVLAVVCDGTGYGPDGNIWGFEFLKVFKDQSKFERVGHLDYFMLPGGDKASRELDRLAISLTGHLDDVSVLNLNKDRLKTIKTLMLSGVNCPLCSSLGRLFDGVACICGVLDTADYEAQGAIRLQKYAEDFKGSLSSAYPISVKDGKIDHRVLVDGLISDISSGKSKEELAYKFHIWVVDSIVATILQLSPKKAVFSGGCFQNSLLVNLLRGRLSNINDVDIYFNNDIPTNDAGISFGQSVI